MSAFGSSSEAEFPYPVYTGVWTNWSSGRVLGATLTLTQENANLLIAFIALFAALVTGHLWRIVCFSIHGFLSTPKVQDALHHQRQVLLRNNAGAASSALTLIEIWWAWRKRVSAWRVLPLFVCTLLLTVLFAFASGYSSRIAIGNEVLILGANCGAVSPPSDINSTGALNVILPYQANLLTASAIQATHCYSDEVGAGVDCSTYVRRHLAISVDRNASCPFGNLCRNEYGNIFFDTGFHDSREDLGLNTPDDEVFLRRRVSHCAPLKTEGYSSTISLPNNRSYTKYFYGSVAEQDYLYLATNTGYDRDLIGLDPLLNQEYKLRVKRVLFQDGRSFDGRTQLIDELAASGGDIALISLSANGVLFVEKVLDPWYQATHTQASDFTYIGATNGTSKGSGKFYLQDQPGSPLACTEKWQWCLPLASGGRYCTRLGPLNDVYEDASTNSFGPSTTELVDWIFSQIEISHSAAPNIMGVQALLSRKKLDEGYQGSLPDNQWQMDVEYWFQISMAAYQKVFVDTAAGPLPSMPEDFVKRPANDVQTKLCNNQKVISTAHTSFSVFALAFVLLGGVCIIAIAISIEPIVGFIQKRTKVNPYSRMEWIAGGTFQLQRLAHEELGISDWSGTDRSIPTTRTMVKLSPLDISDPKHPRFLNQLSRSESQRPKEGVSVETRSVGDSIERTSE
ncbi:hypothetical protein GGR53DRAFT_527966 [Hypoxylon sp. FL1150]|nr:hypothetical protein GGR53DRAFT_527966 [Hypoxylon sp. FL1150]